MRVCVSAVATAVSALILVFPIRSLAQSTPWQVLIDGDDANTPHEPSGVVVDGQGSVYVVDTSGSRIEKLSPSGRVLMAFGHVGNGNDALRRPRGIALDAQGTLWVADTANHRIQRFAAATGEPLGTLGVIGSDPGEFILPTSLALDSVGNVYVADTGNHRVQKLAPDGQPVAAWGGLDFPHGIALDDQDNVYVTDSAGLRKFSPTGDLLAEWTAPGEFGDPYGVGIGPDGTLYVADTDNGRIKAMSTEGVLLTTWGSQGSSVGQLIHPEAVAIDASGAVYVADRGNNRVQVFRP